jgi:hypothetical protein
MFFAVWALAALSLSANPRDPFPLGYPMMSQGALVETEGVSGRQPWTPAACYRDTLRWGASMAAVSYHGGGSAARYAVGGFMMVGPVVGKLSLTQLDVMGLYYEQAAALSAGSQWRFLSFSLDGQAYRAGLAGRVPDAPPSSPAYQSQSPRSRTSAALGTTILLQTRRISADVVAEGVTVLTSGDPAADPVPSITARVCTVRNRYGSQGAAVRITPEHDSPLRLILAQEYRIGETFALSASIASNPTMIGFGLTVDKSPVTGAAAVVNHPFLGWSKGVMVDYAR